MSSKDRFSNHLIGENSPYLLQHAHNPVDWYPWGEAAFDKAKSENKPILLSIGYSTCHWCHVMAHESFEDEGIAMVINEYFIAIKVDREERGDIDHIYMSAVTALTGAGGWPLTVFLTPQAEPFYGGTYFPPYAKWGTVGFSDLLGSIAKAWSSDRDNIISSGRDIVDGLRSRQERSNVPSKAMDQGTLDLALRQMSGQYDPSEGGFGTAPKFPMGHMISFLLRCYEHDPKPHTLEMIEKTLTAMARGGIRDHLGGGFHRYSTDQHWHVPHFEKMLYDQALLSRAYLEAYQATSAYEYAEIAAETLDYVLEILSDPQGGFYCAQDADSPDESGTLKEGAYYIFSESEIEKILGENAAVFNYYYGVLPQGNVSHDPHGEFIGKNILFQAHSLEDCVKEFSKDKSEIEQILSEGTVLILAHRSHRVSVQTDDKVLCDWNGLMIASLALASRVLGQEKYYQAAQRSADFILTKMMENKRLLHRWKGGSAGITATLEDYAFFIYGLLELYEAGFEEKYLAESQLLADEMIRLFADKEGGFYMTASDAQSLILRPKEVYDGALPSGNSVTVLVLLKLYALTQKDEYQRQANRCFDHFAPQVSRMPYAYGFFLSAFQWHLQGPVEITFEGPQKDATIAKMVKVLYKYFIPAKAVKHICPVNEGVFAHLCVKGTCQAPINSVSEFEEMLVGSIKGRI